MSKLTIIEISPTVPAADQADAALVLVWMLSNAEAHETATSLAEEAVECALDREPWEWLDDDTHWIWDLAAAVFAAR